MKICPQCMEPLKEYVGLDGRYGDPNNPWDCPNKSCSPETIEAARVGGDDRCNGDLYYYKTIGAWRCRACNSQLTSDYLDVWGFDECPMIIPTQSEPDRSSAALGAKTASSQRLRISGLNAEDQPVEEDVQLPLAPDLSLDDPDQCTLQQQGSDLPPLSGTPKLGYVTLDAETLRASMSNRGAFLPIKKE